MGGKEKSSDSRSGDERCLRRNDQALLLLIKFGSGAAGSERELRTMASEKKRNEIREETTKNVSNNISNFCPAGEGESSFVLY